MNIKLYVVGKIEHKFYQEAMQEYVKRLTRYCKIQVIFLKRSSEVKEQSIKNDHIVSINKQGTSFTSEEFSKKIENWGLKSITNISFFIGEGEVPLGENLSITSFALSHEMTAVILLEQIYRGYRILKKEPYHK